MTDSHNAPRLERESERPASPRPAPAPAPAEKPSATSGGQLSLLGAITLVVGSIVGVGIFNVPSSLAPDGPITIVSMGLTTVGALALARLFASLSRGLIHGVADFFAKELGAGVACAAYAFVFTYAMLRVIDLITAVRVGAEEERGLDAAELGEAAYVLDAPAPAVRPSAAPADG